MVQPLDWVATPSPRPDGAQDTDSLAPLQGVRGAAADSAAVPQANLLRASGANLMRLFHSLAIMPDACAFSHHAFLEARNYARQREAFGQRLVESPLIQETLLKLLARTWRSRLLTFRLIQMVDENGLVPASEEQAMWQRFLTNLAKYRTALPLMDSLREAMLVLGGNGIVEDFTVLPRLFRDAMIIETWEGPPNTLCLQIMRDAARSNLLQRLQAEISGSLERWPKDFLSHTRRRVEQQLDSLKRVLAENLSDNNWIIANARRVVDGMGSLIELAWLAEMAARHNEDDSTAALITSFAGWELFDDYAFNHPIAASLARHGADLIEEKPVSSALVDKL